MGGGESRYVEDQERFVRANIDIFKKELPSHLSKSQIAGKLRQLYANTDTNNENKNSYILSHNWIDAKNKIIPIYANYDEKRGIRRYH
jgi:hypothetical protein